MSKIRAFHFTCHKLVHFTYHKLVHFISHFTNECFSLHISQMSVFYFRSHKLVHCNILLPLVDTWSKENNIQCTCRWRYHKFSSYYIRTMLNLGMLFDVYSCCNNSEKSSSPKICVGVFVLPLFWKHRSKVALYL